MNHLIEEEAHLSVETFYKVGLKATIIAMTRNLIQMDIMCYFPGLSS